MDIAYAMGTAGGTGAGGGNPMSFFVMLGLMFAVMWFFLIRPQQKKQKEHRNMLAAVKKGDRIITSGGLHGRVTGTSENTLTVEIADKVRVKINRGHIAAVVTGSSDNDKAPEKDK